MSALDDSLDTPYVGNASLSTQPDAGGTDADDRPELAALVHAARRGEPGAWNRLVQRFTPLIRTITSRYRLGEHDAEDVGQVVWLRLVQHIQRLREPLALPGWITTTARHESLRLARAHGRTLLLDPLEDSVRDRAADHPNVDADLLQDEQVEAMRQGLAELSTVQRDLLLLLTADPPLSYREISLRLGMPIGSIGPTRARTLARLEATSAVSRYIASGCITVGSRKVASRTCAA
jgi:RNA polymerase sigma factor (sigma-70 family)